MDLEIIILSEVIQKENYRMISLICNIWSFTQIHLWNRNSLTDTENRLVVTKEDGNSRGMDWEFGLSWCELLYMEQINSMVLMFSSGIYIQHPVISKP